MTQTPPKLPKFEVVDGCGAYWWRLTYRGKTLLEPPSDEAWATKRAADRAGRRILTRLVKEGWE